MVYTKAKAMIYLVGKWVSTGPRANDCYFEVYFVSFDLDEARAQATRDGADIMRAKSGEHFAEWETVT